MSRMHSPMVRRIAGAAFFAALGASVVGFGIASADDASPSNDPAPVSRHARPQLTDEQRACLEGKGITKPEPGTRPTDAQRDAMRQAAQDCGIQLPMRHRGDHPALTDEQKACLEGKGITKPEPGTRPTDAQRDAMRQAAQDCGIQLPMRHRFERRFGITDEQRACLQGKGLSRPEPGTRPTDAQRDAMRQAAQECGVNLPERPMGPGPDGDGGPGMGEPGPMAGAGMAS